VFSTFPSTHTVACCLCLLLDIGSVLEPFLLRRLKTDVLKDIPRKSEVILYHGLSAIQKTYYKAVLRKDVGESFFTAARSFTFSTNTQFGPFCSLSLVLLY